LRAKHTTFNLDLFNLQAVILLEDREKGKGHRHIMLGRDMPRAASMSSEDIQARTCRLQRWCLCPRGSCSQHSREGPRPATGCPIRRMPTLSAALVLAVGVVQPKIAFDPECSPQHQRKSPVDRAKQTVVPLDDPLFGAWHLPRWTKDLSCWSGSRWYQPE